METISQDIPRIYTAIAEWLACSCYIYFMNKKGKRKTRIFFFLSYLIGFCILQLFAGTLAVVWWIPTMLLAIGFMYLYIYTICDIPLADIGFLCARAFLLAEFVASLGWQIYFFIGKNSLWVQASIMTITYLVVCGVYMHLEAKHFTEKKYVEITLREIFDSFLIASAVFFISNVSFVYNNTVFSVSGFSILYVRTLVDFGGLAVLFNQLDNKQKMHMQMEVEAINSILNRQYEQYQMSKDNMELLKQQFHDLKHLIFAIRSEEEPAKREGYLLKLEESIAIQEAFTETGNGVLDTLLTTKGIYCVQNNIQFTYFGDGKLLDFMDVSDICTIFGNALDNAIESVEKLKDEDKRLIHISIYKKKNLLMLEFENYCGTELEMEGDFPVTTKQNKSFHGYGLKSMKLTALKYGGSMRINTRNQWFALRILIPLKCQAD